MLLDGVKVFGLLLAALNLGAQEPRLTREGPNSWVHTVKGEASLTPQRRLAVVARGHIIVRGGSGQRITYKLVQRVHARTEQEANQLVGNGSLDDRTFGPSSRIYVEQRSSLNVGNELEISVPRQMALVSVRSELGGVEIYDLDGSVDAGTPAGDIRADRIGGALSARAGGGHIILGTIGGLVECYTGAGSITVENAMAGVKSCETGGGDLEVKQAGAPIVLANDGGNISVRKAAASVQARAVSGLIQIGEAGGLVIADSQGGSIQVGSARGVRAESSQGTVRVRSASGPMTVSTALGNILAELVAGARIQDSLLAASSGDITVMIPPNFPLSIMVTDDMGAYPRFVSEFPEVRRPETLGFTRAPVVAEGAINGGGPVLHINAGTGAVYLRRSR
ncbi:MAG: hypothetical protein JO307_21880 [Bryobacterales bacterium]|nr:hypothetical protein [Bryobacterales bacterium]MBV9401153.1 hypothetical protein [Bryobacterales bacterium]